MPSPYDDLEYPSVALPQTHPNRLATLAILHGMKPELDAPRVLDLGCGDGLNLIAIAVAMPRAQCLGIDLAARPIARGCELIGRVGAGNVTLRQMDLIDVSPEIGTFDYIVAHGLYSWVPTNVRDRLLDICRRNLAPQGVAFISYNAWPGAYLRQMCRHMMLFHVRAIGEPARRVTEARNFLAFLARSHEQNNPITQMLSGEAQRIAQLPDGQVFHDDLSPINEPIAFDEFAAHAARHGLQFLAESDLESIGTEGLPPPVQAELARLAGSDVVARQSYIDFVRDVPYRQTLLCDANVALSRPPTPDDVRKLFVTSQLRPVSAPPEIHTARMEAFQGAGGGNASTDDPLAKGALVVLSESAPRAIAFDELLELARARAQLPSDAGHVQQLAKILLALCTGGLVQLHACPPKVVLEPAERPLASPLARVQASGGETVTTLNGITTRVHGDPTRALVQLLDGTRDRAALAAELARAITADSDKLAAQIDATLVQLGRVGLLVK